MQKLVTAKEYTKSHDVKKKKAEISTKDLPDKDCQMCRT